MYPHVFPPHWINGFWYNFFQPLLFCEINEKWDWVGNLVAWKGWEKGHIRGDFLGGHHGFTISCLPYYISFCALITKENLETIDTSRKCTCQVLSKFYIKLKGILLTLESEFNEVRFFKWAYNPNAFMKKNISKTFFKASKNGYFKSWHSG